MKSLEAVGGCPCERVRSGGSATCLSACNKAMGARTGDIRSGEALGAWRASSAFCGGIDLPEGILECSMGSVASLTILVGRQILAGGRIDLYREQQHTMLASLQ